MGESDLKSNFETKLKSRDVPHKGTKIEDFTEKEEK